MSYALRAPTKDPVVLALREQRERVRRELSRLDAELDKALPTPMCRLCQIRPCLGSFRWDVCGYCYNKHNGQPPEPP